MKRKKSFHLGRVFKILFLVLAFLYLLHLFSGSSYAATGMNHHVSFQGKRTPSDVPTVIDENYPVVFSFYNVPTGGLALWIKTQTIAARKGIFKVMLGSITAVPESSHFNRDGFSFGIIVGLDSEIAPRFQMAAVPFARTALSMQTNQDMKTAESDARTANVTPSAPLTGDLSGLTAQSSTSLSGVALGASDSALGRGEVDNT